MAKARKPKGQLGDWLDDIPEAVQKAADEYDKAHTDAQKAKGKFNTAKQNVIDKMREHKVKRVPIRNGEKFLVFRAKDGVVIKKPQEKPGAEGESGTGGRGRGKNSAPPDNGATETIFDKAAKGNA